jgi:hypothetical protein
MVLGKRWSVVGLLGVTLLVGVWAAWRTRPIRAAEAARTFYVSPGGSNGDGLSWAQAWRDLDDINWTAIQPGDTILLDGGPTACPALGPGYNCGIVYASTLSINKAGTSQAPITLRLASEPGRNGAVIIDGGLTQWSRCSDYASEPTPPSVPNGGGPRETGITLGSSQWIVLDGTKWGGIEVRNHTRYGLNFSSSQHVTARYLKIHHNTDPADTSNNAVGVTQGYQSQHNTLARSEIFRNGQDAVRGAGDYFTLEENYLHSHYCNHPDGVQAFVPTSNGDIPDNAGEIRGLVIRRNVFERIGLQAIFLGENAVHDSWTVDVTIENNLFLNNPYMIKSKSGRSNNWLVRNNTLYGSNKLAVEWCCASPGATSPMVVADNIIANVSEGATAFVLTTGGGATTFANNCLYRTGRRSGNFNEVGTIQADPGFVDPGGANLALFPGSACAGRGANITSVPDLLAQTGAATPLVPRGLNDVFLPLLNRR